jgi:hypothetical protein
MLIWKEVSSGAEDAVAKNEICGSGTSGASLTPDAVTLCLLSQIMSCVDFLREYHLPSAGGDVEYKNIRGDDRQDKPQPL